MSDQRKSDRSDDTQRGEGTAGRGAHLDDPKADRPGGPGQAGGNIVAPGEVAPAATTSDVPDEDDAVKDRQEHLKASGQ